MKIILYAGSIDGAGLSQGYGPMGVGLTRLWEAHFPNHDILYPA